MKRILCPVDFSPTANNAVEYAARFAKTIGASITFLNIQELPYIGMESPVSGFDEAYLQMREASQERLEKYCLEVEKEFGVSCTAKVNAINLPLALSKEAEKGYDLIIMGASDSSGLDSNLFGNNAYQAIKRTECPLLIVHENVEYSEIKNMVFATDYNSHDELTLKQLKSFFENSCPQMTVFHVSEDATEVSEEVYKAFKSYVEDELDCPHQIHFKRVINEDEVAAIHAFMESSAADLLVMTTHRRNFVQQMLHKSVTKQIVTEATYPVLVLHV